MAFTSAELVDLRRHCGFPLYGASGWNTSADYGLLNFRLTNMSSDEEAIVRTQYLANLATLEAAIPAAGAMLGTEQAAVWTRNANEVADRSRLFDSWRRRLCAFIGIPPGPGLQPAGSIIRS